MTGSRLDMDPLSPFLAISPPIFRLDSDFAWNHTLSPYESLRIGTQLFARLLRGLLPPYLSQLAHLQYSHLVPHLVT